MILFQLWLRNVEKSQKGSCHINRKEQETVKFYIILETHFSGCQKIYMKIRKKYHSLDKLETQFGRKKIPYIQCTLKWQILVQENENILQCYNIQKGILILFNKVFYSATFSFINKHVKHKLLNLVDSIDVLPQHCIHAIKLIICTDVHTILNCFKLSY